MTQHNNQNDSRYTVKNLKTWRNKLKRAGLSTVLVASGMIGYAALSHLDTSSAAELNDAVFVAEEFDQQGPGGGPGGHHDQELADDAYDPSDLVTVDPDAADLTDPEAEVVEGAVYRDGQYVGDAIRADRWGNMQVVAVIEDGELTDVLIASYPRNTTLSDVISRNAMPTLIEEAIENQSADINIISRATDTCVAFIRSLESALEDARVDVVDTEAAG